MHLGLILKGCCFGLFSSHISCYNTGESEGQAKAHLSSEYNMKHTTHTKERKTLFLPLNKMFCSTQLFYNRRNCYFPKKTNKNMTCV